MINRWLLILLLGLASAAVPAAALAHKIKVFASAEGAVISGYAYVTGGTRVKDAAVRIIAADDRVLEETSIDAAGNFRFEAKEPIDHRIIVDAGGGHVAEFTLKASELTGMNGAAPIAAAIDADTPAQPKSVTLSAATLQALVDQAVARQLRPLREQLDAYQAEARWHDVLGGIGYILGIAGIAFYFLARRQPPS